MGLAAAPWLVYNTRKQKGVRPMKKLWLCLLASSLLLAGCGQEEAVPLTQQEIARANAAFAYSEAVVEENHTTVYPSEVSCFFTSFYEELSQIDLAEFLRYCPVGSDLKDSDVEEFRAVMEARGRDTERFPLPSDFVLPVHRFRKADVSALLKKYADITVDSMTNTDGILYLEAYDAYYNFTSDFAPGYFECVEGEREGNIIRFRSAPHWEDGLVRELVVREVEGKFYIQSFQQIAHE